MVLASHHVLKEITDALDSGDMHEFVDMCKKFCERYPKDEELLAIICGDASPAEEYLIKRDEASLAKLKEALHNLWNLRHIESGGGEKLWYKDRRP